MSQLRELAYTLLRVFFGSLLGFIIASGVGVLEMTSADWKLAAGAGIAAVLVAAFNALNPKDGRYGIWVPK